MFTNKHSHKQTCVQYATERLQWNINRNSNRKFHLPVCNQAKAALWRIFSWELTCLISLYPFCRLQDSSRPGLVGGPVVSVETVGVDPDVGLVVGISVSPDIAGLEVGVSVE